MHTIYKIVEILKKALSSVPFFMEYIDFILFRLFVPIRLNLQWKCDCGKWILAYESVNYQQG